MSNRSINFPSQTSSACQLVCSLCFTLLKIFVYIDLYYFEFGVSAFSPSPPRLAHCRRCLVAVLPYRHLSSCLPRVLNLNSKRSLQRRTRYRRRTLHRTARPHLITFKTCRSVAFRARFGCPLSFTSPSKYSTYMYNLF